MKRGFKILGFFGLAVFTGVVTALLMSGLVGNHRPKLATSINVQNWKSDWAIGTQATTPYMRAYIARRGLLALPKSEAVYFFRNKDDDGKLLTEQCTYIITGSAQMAKWWSMTLYDSRDLLPLNDDGAYSVDQTGIGDGDWEVMLQPHRHDNKENWLSSRNAGEFDLTLRLYKPEAVLLASPYDNFNPPSIKRISCRQGDL